jgi:hypothetical protein
MAVLVVASFHNTGNRLAWWDTSPTLDVESVNSTALGQITHKRSDQSIRTTMLSYRWQCQRLLRMMAMASLERLRVVVVADISNSLTIPHTTSLTEIGMTMVEVTFCKKRNVHTKKKKTIRTHSTVCKLSCNTISLLSSSTSVSMCANK